MNNCTKEQIGSDVCKSHSSRTERELYRICPSKLSKRELEDLYFALLENNLDLKKTINAQKDRIKGLSTRLQRMTVVQKNAAGKEKDCCASKAVVTEQKESISDLKKTNERMAERIRLLNMRLCSAKQFLKRTTSHASHPNKTSSFKCFRLDTSGREAQHRNSSLSALTAKQSDSNMRTSVVSCQLLDMDASARTSKVVENKTAEPVKEGLEKLCDENKCRTIMEELKEKIVNLQEELSTSHTEYSQRIAKLESQVSKLHDENMRVRSDHVASEHALQQRMERADELQAKLRTANAKCNDLNMELSIEKSKVSELEMGLKLANMSNHVVKTIEQLADTKALVPMHTSTPPTKDEVKFSMADDSGCTDLNKSSETDEVLAMAKVNLDLLNKIAELQTELDLLKISAAGVVVQQDENPKEFESYDVEIKEVDETLIQNAEDLGSMIIDAEPVTEKCSLDVLKNVAEKDNSADTTPGQNSKASTSQPWEGYMVTGRSETQEGNEDNKISNNKSVSSITIKEISEFKVGRTDEHNSLQIPGPVPVSNSSQSFSKDKRKYRRKDSCNERTRNKSISDDKPIKIFDNSKESYYNSDKQNTDNELIKEDNSEFSAVAANLKQYATDVDTRERKNKDVIEKKSKNVSITDAEAIFGNRVSVRDSVLEARKKLGSIDNRMTMEEVKKEIDTSFSSNFKSKHTPALSKTTEKMYATEQATQIEDDTDGVYATQVDSRLPLNPRRDSATYTADALKSYTMQVNKHSRATSPDNTEHEISSLTDLPSEKDEKSPRGVLSPGEEKATTTYTDTETNTDYGSLSEGEMPTVGKVRRLSAGERPAVTTSIPKKAGTSPEMMQATLQTISEELARCRRLLLSQRPNEKDAHQYRKGPPKDELKVHALRHSEANRRISDKHLPSCVFKMHIGTLVLSDEAVLYSRNKSLVLTWKFYLQNAAMARVHSERVVLFDFLMEYDVTLSEEFLDYMKHSEMSIILCEMGKLDEPFAMCSLPLREVLQHANRRVYRSLALVSSLPAGVVRDNMGEEIGILDLWYILKVDASLLPAIHRAMHMPSSLMNLQQSDLTVVQLSREQDLIARNSNSTQPHAARAQATNAPTMVSRRYSTANDKYHESTEPDPSSRYDNEVQPYRASMPYERRSSQTQKPALALDHKGQVGFENNRDTMRQASSGIIFNEVVSDIPKENMKQALEDASYSRSSNGSMKCLTPKRLSSNLQWSMKNSSKEHVESLKQFFKKDKIPSTDGVSTSVEAASTKENGKDDSNQSMSKTNSINKYIGVPSLNKLMEAFKKSVNHTDSLNRQEPQKGSSAANNTEENTQSIDITILWLALNEECDAMVNPNIQRLYVAYSFLERSGADLETPVSLPKPKHYADKCYFNFKTTFYLDESDMLLLGHMSKCRSGSGASKDPRDYLAFTLVSEPPEDPLGLSSCEDIGYAYLYMGDVLSSSGGSDGYTEVIGVRGVRGGVCGVLAVRVDNLSVLSRCLSFSQLLRDLPSASLSRNTLHQF